MVRFQILWKIVVEANGRRVKLKKKIKANESLPLVRLSLRMDTVIIT